MTPETVTTPVTPDTTDIPADEQPTQVLDPVGPLSPDEQPTEVMPGPGEPPADSQPPADDAELAHGLQLKIVDASEGVVAKAADYADAHLAEQTTQGGFRGILKRIWHGNLARDYIRLRRTQQGREEIVETGNLYTLEDGSQVEHDQEMAAVITRFTDGYLHDGEREDRLSDSENGASLEGELRTLINFYAQGEIDADVLTEEKNRVLARYQEQLHDEDRNKGLLLADNVVEVARNARAALQHGIGMDRIQAALTADVGEARVGQRTEVRRELTDKIVDKLYAHRLGSLVNETTLAVAAGIGVTAAKLATRKAITAAAATVSMGVGAGVIAGLREHARVGQERQLHLRQRAAGQEAPAEDDTRRAQMEETRYTTVSADELTDRLAQAREAVAAAEPAGIQDALQTISEAEARIRLSDQESVDLIDFSRTTSLEQERLKLDIALAEAKVAASQALRSADESALQTQGLDRDLDTVLARQLEGVQDILSEDMSAKDAAFAKLRRIRTAKMAAAGLLTGVAIGEAVQEAHALFSDSLKGVFEGPNSHITRHTLLAGLLNNPSGNASYHNGVHEAILGKHAALELPKNFHLDQTSKGHWNLIGPDGKPVAENLTLNSHGHLSDSSLEALQHSGLHMNERTQEYTTRSVVHHTIHRSPQEFMSRHPADFTHVQRQFWYDNDTPGVFDKNELKLDWGADGTGVDAHGNYVFNVAEMLPDGSYHDGFSANAQQLFHEGKMAIALSMTQGTENHVVMVPIDAEGNAVIHANSWMAKSLFENHGGQASFTGAYAEAVQLLGKHDGTEVMRPLATVVGSGHPHEITDTVSKVITHHEERLVMHMIHGHHHIEIPPVLPIYSRRGLESPEEAPAGGAAYLGGYIQEGYRDGENLLPRQGLAPFSPELEGDPDAKIDANTTTRLYLRSLRPSYRRIIGNLSKDLDKEPKANKPRLVVMIPAAAHQEGGNIRRTLEQYANQEDIDRGDFEVVVFANYPRGERRDRTIREVQQFQRDNPGINVRLIQKRLEKDEANIGWIRKTLTDTVLADLSERGVDLNEVMLVSNDADSQWINPKYLKTIIDKAEASPDTDGFLGFIDWSYDAYKAHPEMLASTRFMQMLETYLRVAKHEVGSSGANFAFRPSIYSAVGGYNPSTPLGEDVVLGRMIKSVRSGAQTRRPITFLGRSSEVNTSARRALDKLLRDGGAPAAQWDQFGVNDELRDRDFDLRDFDFNDEEAVRRMITNTQAMLNQTLQIYSRALQSQNSAPTYRQGRLTLYDNETLRQIDRICFFLGLQVRWRADGTLRINDASKMIAGMRDWQASH
ncbi:MAG TPA: glycosyltransferase [Candidatus Saccharimonadales bacterium]|nr:glycosyltransferase [Candidatus Saccharimonadales bacterium]